MLTTKGLINTNETPFTSRISLNKNDTTTPASFGNHSWYYKIMCREKDDFINIPDCFSGAIAPSWTTGVNGEWVNSFIIIRPVIENVENFSKYVTKIAKEKNNAILVKQIPKY